MNPALVLFLSLTGATGAALFGVSPFSHMGEAPPSAGPVLEAAPAVAPPETEVWDLEYGAYLAETCSACHGEDQPGAPLLEGRSFAELREALEAYASGARRHDQMGVVARSLTAEERGHVAAWLASRPAR